jgi:hypothetical protein
MRATQAWLGRYYLNIIFYLFMIYLTRTGVAQYSVWLQTRRSAFDPRQRQKDFSSSFCAQTSSEAHPASYPMGTGGPFSRVNRDRGVMLTTHPLISGVIPTFARRDRCEENREKPVRITSFLTKVWTQTYRLRNGWSNHSARTFCSWK